MGPSLHPDNEMSLKCSHETQHQKKRIVHASGEEIARQLARGEYHTDWKRVRAMSQADVQRLADKEEGPLLKEREKTACLGPTAGKARALR